VKTSTTNYLRDHPGAVAITTAQVLVLVPMLTAEGWRIAAAELCHFLPAKAFLS